jgi:uncharacterized RDD family membrane protein YckC
MSTNISEPNAQGYCTECGGRFALDEMIRHGGLYICNNCKPRFMQKLSEGAQIGAGRRYAGFWLRFAAFCIDAILVGVINLVLQMFALFAMSQNLNPQQPPIMLLLVLYAISLGIAVSYEGLLIGKYGATVGKMACKMKVITGDGTPVSYPRAFGRYFAKVLSSLTLLIGFIIAAFDVEKRALHDRICNTRVVVQ